VRDNRTEDLTFDALHGEQGQEAAMVMITKEDRLVDLDRAIQDAMQRSGRLNGSFPCPW